MQFYVSLYNSIGPKQCSRWSMIAQNYKYSLIITQLSQYYILICLLLFGILGTQKTSNTFLFLIFCICPNIKVHPAGFRSWKSALCLLVSLAGAPVWSALQPTTDGQRPLLQPAHQISQLPPTDGPRLVCWLEDNKNLEQRHRQ